VSGRSSSRGTGVPACHSVWQANILLGVPDGLWAQHPTRRPTVRAVEIWYLELGAWERSDLTRPDGLRTVNRLYATVVEFVESNRAQRISARSETVLGHALDKCAARKRAIWATGEFVSLCNWELVLGA